MASLIWNKAGLDEKAVKLREKLDLLRKDKDLLGKAVGEVPLLEKQMREKNGEVVKLEAEMEELSAEIGKLQPEAEKLSKVQQPTPKTEAELKEELKNVRGKERELRLAENVIGAKISDYESVEQNQVCPTCDRPADPDGI